MMKNSQDGRSLSRPQQERRDGLRRGEDNVFMSVSYPFIECMACSAVCGWHPGLIRDEP